MIYDCFMFNDELDLLEMRLNHHQFVDKFIIIECSKTYSGISKPLYYMDTRERFKQFQDKIYHIIIDFPYETNDNWKYEHLQRNILKGYSFNSNDIVIYSDCDEFIRDKSIIDTFINSGKDIISTQMDLCFYYLNTRVKQVTLTDATYHVHTCFKSKWHMGKIIKANIIPKFDNLYQIREDRIGNPDYIPMAGWHFSNLGSADRIYNKLKAISHCNDPEFQDISSSKIDSRKNNLADPLGRGGVTFEIFNDLPKYIIDNKERFNEYFYS